MSGFLHVGKVETGNASEAVAEVVVCGNVCSLNDIVGGEFDLLAGLAGHVEDEVGNVSAVDCHGQEFVAGGDVLCHSGVDQLLAEGDEFSVLADEVGFTAEHEDETLGVVGVHFGDDTSLVGGAVGTFGGHFLTLLAEDVNSFFEIAFGFHQSLLAIHHTDTGSFSQFVNLSCSYFNFHFLRFSGG